MKGPQISGTLTSFARHPRRAGEWTGLFSTEVDWVKNRLSGKMAAFEHEKKVRVVLS